MIDKRVQNMTKIDTVVIPAIAPTPSSLLDGEESKGYATNDEIALIFLKIDVRFPSPIEMSSCFSMESLEIEASSFDNDIVTRQVTC